MWESTRRIFAGPDEAIEFKHTAYSKAVFGKGAVEAAKFLKGKGPGMYNMSNVINGRSLTESAQWGLYTVM